MSGGHGHGGRNQGEKVKAKNFGKTLKRLLGYMSKRLYLILIHLL